MMPVIIKQYEFRGTQSLKIKLHDSLNGKPKAAMQWPIIHVQTSSEIYKVKKGC
jgi:hypothetical protein